MLESLAVLISRHRFTTLVVTGVILLLSVFSVVRGGPLTGGKIEGLEADQAQSLIDAINGRSSETTFVVVFRNKEAAANASGGLPTDKATLAKEIDATLSRVSGHPSVASVLSPNDPTSPLAERFWNEAAGTALALVTLKGDFAEALAAFEAVHKELNSGKLAVTCTGKVPFTHDLNQTLEHDLLKAEVVSLPIALLVLVFVFRTVTAAALPVGVGALAVLSGIAVVLGISHFTDIAQYTINVCSLIGLGVAIDYSLFIVSRYREELAHGKDYESALATSLNTAGRVVLFSGFAVCTGMSGLFFFHGSYLFAMGVGGAIVIGLAVLFALTFLPALLAVLGPRINAGSLRRKPENNADSPWHRTALFVMRHPVLTLVPTLGVLLLMGYPFLHLQLLSADVRVLDHSIEARQGHDLLRAYFPDQAATRVEVAVQFPSGDALNADRISALHTLVEQVKQLPGVERVESVLDVAAPIIAAQMAATQAAVARGQAAAMEGGATAQAAAIARGKAAGQGAAVGQGAADLEAKAQAQLAALAAQPRDAKSPAAIAGLLASPPPQAAAMVNAAKAMFARDNVQVLHVLTQGVPESETARELVRWLRAHRSLGDGQIIVGGQTANDLDSTHFILSRAPYAAITVVSVTLLVLFFLLQSVLLPIKAVVMNFLSIAGSFGALVWIFQDGHFVSEARPLEPSLPVLLFCIVFGLSMDYEVLMLSRMKEAYDQGMDNTHAVAEGLERSAGLITSAAAIMVTVFAAFALARVVLIQAVGVGMALAVTLDATLVRVLLVPSTMRLFGELNWWAPSWLGGRKRGKLSSDSAADKQ